MRCDAAVYFSDVDLSVGIRVDRLVSSTLAELQAITLALECVFSHSSVVVYLDSQAALNACATELVLAFSNFRNHYWMEWHSVVNLIRDKKLSVSWHKVKKHLGVMGNEHVDELANSAASSNLVLPVLIKKIFIKTSEMAVSGNV
ncbi:hypothetical protein G9A89_022069 [Geosiphon pyriformis]|nr:hypothetical protein G9A89_022069 [Geosiphon pyriformis]